ncbi:MAG: hypothetical protein WBB18_10030 [Nodosilinea sp.]
MPRTFLHTSTPSEDESRPLLKGNSSKETTSGHREKVRILVIGCPTAIDRVVSEMSHVGFSDSIEWSKPMPTDRQQESMRVLTRYVFSGSEQALEG